MPPPTGTQRAIDTAHPMFEPRVKALASRPGSAPIATSIVLFVVVAALLGFIAWL